MKLLPDVERELAAQGVRYRVVRTESLEHGISEARSAAESGEVPVVMSGDGLVGQVGGALAGTATPMGILPGGRGNDLARVLSIPSEPAGAVAVLADGHERQIDIGEANGQPFLCVASCGFDSDANRIANEARLVKGNLVYAYAAFRALVAWKPARFTVMIDAGEPIAVRRLFGRGRKQPCLRGRHVHRPSRRARRRAAGRDHRQQRGQAALPQGPAQGLQGHPSGKRRGLRAQGYNGRDHGRTAISPSTPTASTSPTCRPPCGSSPAPSP